MKINSSQYAKALYAATKDQPQEKVVEAVFNFVKMLAKGNQLKHEKKIIQKFVEIYNQESNIVEAQVTSREKLSAQMLEQMVGFLKNKYGAAEAVVHNVVNPEIQGGVVVRVGDELMDTSVAKQLSDLKNRLSN
jgi:F-type H+-transporting ATPase subunit delta